VLGNADLALREVPRGASGRQAIEDIRTAGLRAAELTNQLLAYAGRGGAGTIPVYPRELVDELLRLTAPTWPAGVAIETEIPDDLAVRGDPAQVRQVLMNLLINARDAIGERGGTIALRAKLYHHDGQPHADDILTPAAGRYVRIEVADNGPGMTADHRSRVFEPFFSTKPTGHGLGLAALLGIVKAHGGGVRVTSQPGDGARFLIYWPAVASAERAAAPAPQAMRTVLVIDDEDLVRDVVARMIEELGYNAVTAADGQTALSVVERIDVDAAIVDLTMPAMNGAAVVAELRKKRPLLPVVLCSGFDRSGQGRVDADAYLAKPFRIDALERTLAKVLALRSV
jgi:CheY-like chemotaxis protein